MKTLISILMCLFFFGCATTWTPPEGCVNPDGSYKNSLIIEHIDNPGRVGVVFELTNLEVLKNTDLYSPEQAMHYIDVIEEKIDSGITWMELFNFIVQRSAAINDLLGEEIVVISWQYIELYKPIPLSMCDKVILKAHLENQREVVRLVM